jgi:hypothetical protein
MRQSSKVLAVIAFALAGQAASASDVVVDWNNQLLGSITSTSQGPPLAARAMAMTHVAMFEAVNSIDRTYAPYKGYYATDAGTNREAAAAQAAHDVLAHLYPSRLADFDSQLASSLASIPDGAGKTSGVALGRLAASGMIQQRTGDGSQNVVTPAAGTAPGQWRPTPPGYLPGAFAQMATTTPFGMSSPTQFRPAAPPSLSSAEYAHDVNEVKRLGSATSTDRTPEQTDIARVWAFGAGSMTPPGAWNKVAQQVAQSNSMGITQSVRMFALLGMAEADAAISAWDCKNAYNLWRPISAIREADTDGNAATDPDASWTPLLTTPNFQSYTSGHSTFSSAAAAILREVTGTDTASFSVSALGITRNFTSFAAAADEAGMSRIYGGIHFGFDNTVGLHCGNAIGEYTAANFFQVPSPSGVLALGGAGAAAAMRRRRR